MPSQVFIGEVVDSWGLYDAYVSSIISWNASDLRHLSIPEPSLPAVDRICRYQLRWCKRSQSEALADLPPRLCAILPHHDLDDPWLERTALVVLNPSTLHATPSPEAHFCCDQEWVAPDGAHVILCDTTADRLVFRIFGLPSLHEQASLCFPETHPIATPSRWYGQALVTWAPSGSHVAVLWDVTQCPDLNANLGPLTIHDGITGQIVCSSHPWAGTSERLLHDFMCTWSPTSSTVLVVQRPIVKMPDLVGCFWLCDLNGFCESLYARDRKVEQVTFSPCGSYVHCEYISDFSGDDSSNHSVIMGGTMGGTERPRNSPPALKMGERQLKWTCDDTAAVLPNSSTLLFLSDAARCSPTIFQQFDGLDELATISGNSRMFQISLSPCGQHIVGALSAQQSSQAGAIPTATNLLVCAPSASLWQAQVSRQHQSCNFAPVGGLHASWLLDSIAWHPCPGKHVVYAISDAAHSIYLINAHLRVCIRVWSWEDLLAMSRRPTRLRHQAQLRETSPIKMMWLPDGSQLAITNAEYLVVLTFDPELATVTH